MSTPRRTRGFTLIELMLAIGLGILVIYTAYSGFRMASQCIVVANRLSLDNSLIRAGYSMAHDQLDYWTNLDDPNDATHETLRLSGLNVSGQNWAYSFTAQAPFPTTLGLPFAPMNATGAAAGAFPANVDPTSGASSGSAVPRNASTGGPMVVLPLVGTVPPANWENDNGFDPTYAWAPHDPRTWFRGNPLEKWLWWVAPNTSPTIMGRYGAFTNVTPTPVFSTYTVNGPYPPPQTSAPSYSANYQASSNYPPHLWYGRQLLGLSRAIGWYGLFDYLPANTMFGYYLSFSQAGGNLWGNTSSAGNLATFYTFPGWNGQNYAPYPWQDPFVANPINPTGWVSNPNGGWYWNFVGQGMGPTTMGVYSLTSTSSYAVSNPYGDSIDNGIIDSNTLAWRCYSYSNSDYSATYNGNNQGAALGLQYFIATTLPLKAIMAGTPTNWPNVLVGCGHYIKSAHYVNLAKIRWTSPLTGQVAELSFDGLGTTLRGARMQRRPGSATGWANWDNATGATNDANMDGPQ